MKSSLILVSGVSAGAVSLTPENWDSVTSGKSVFIKFFAPWCGHCKSIAPAWEKLMTEYESSPHAVVAEVDCTAEGKPICETHGVQGYPTIKHGNPASLEDYQGGRDLEALQAFASSNLGPICGPANLDLCDADKKAQVEGYLAMDVASLDEKIAAAEKEIEDAESTFKSELEKLQATYEKLSKEKEETVKAVKEAGLGLMKSTAAHVKQASKQEL